MFTRICRVLTLYTDIDVHGTGSGKNTNIVAQMECSAECKDITAQGTNLLPPAFYTTAKYLCLNIDTPKKVDCIHIAVESQWLTNIPLQLDFPCTAP